MTKKLFTLFILALLAIPLAWGGEKTITLDWSSFGLTTTYAVKTATVDGYSFTIDQGFKGSANGSSCIQMNSSKGNGILYNTTTILGLKKIAVYVASGNKTYTVTTGASQKPTTNSGTGTNTQSFNAVSGDTYFQLKVSGASYFEKIEITYDDSATPAETVATPTFSLADGTYNEAKSVTISCETTGASIYYTTDGTTPSTSSTLYSGAITVSSSMTLKAKAFKDGMNPSDVATANYIIDIPPVGASVATFNATIDTGTSPLIKGDVTFTCSNGTLDNGSEYRLFKNSTTTFSVPTGYNIVKIAFTGVSSNPVSGFGATTGLTTSGNDGIWEGNAQSVSFTASGAQVRCSLITVYYTAPASTGAEYYLAGDFNSWQQDADYKFTVSDGVCTLEGVNLPDGQEFKIIKVENGTTTWYGGNGGGSHYGIHGGHHSGINLVQNNDNFYIEVGGVTDFSFTLNNTTPSVLAVSRDAQLFVKGDFNNWTKEALTSGSTGWTINKDMTAGQEFGFVNEWGDWYGGNGYWIYKANDMGSALSINSNGNFHMVDAGNYTLTVNAALTTLTVTTTDSQGGSGNEFTLVTAASQIADGSEYVFIYNEANAMGAADGSIRKRIESGSSTFTVNNDVATVYDNSPVSIITLEDADNGLFYIKDEDGKYLYWNSGNSVGTGNTQGKWGFVLQTNGTVNIRYYGTDGTETGRYLRYNASSPRFACYENSQQLFNLYYRQGDRPVITPASQDVKGGLLSGVTITYSGSIANAQIYYTTDGTDPSDSNGTLYQGPFDITTNTGGQKVVKAIAVNGNNQSGIATVTYNFQSPAKPVITPDGDSYDGTQQVTISSADGGVIYYLVDPETAPTNAAGVISGGQVYTPGTTAITLEVGIHKVYAAVDLNDIYSWAQESYTINAGPMSLSFSPAAGTYVNAQNVTITANDAVGECTIYYTTDGTTASASSTVYSGPITVAEDMTINAYAVDSRPQGLAGKTATASASYKIGVQPVQYSPIPGDYYKGDDGDITVEMFSVTPNAKIYYTMTDDGSEPADPTTSSTLYTGDIALETGKTYKFKAIAAAGQQVTAVSPATYTISDRGNSGWVNVKEMNTDDNYSTADVLLNPVQVVYMSTWRHRGTKPEFCFVRDNSGYGMVYFGGSNVSDYNSWTKFQMGDWLPGNSVSGTLNVWSDSFINELGGSSGTLSTWPSSSLGNSDILPEETTNLAITQGWTYEGPFTPTENDKYEDHIDADKNLFGHYVHMRKNTIEVKTPNNPTNVTDDNLLKKYGGIITDQSGVPLNYYDGLYLFSGYNGTPDYNQDFFDNIQNNGGTFDIYAIVYFYGQNATKEEYSYAPYEIFPIDFMWIYKPMFSIAEGTYYEPQTVALTCATEGAQIWYKTSEMEDYALYTGPITVDATTTIDAYSTLPTKYNDVMESTVNSITINIGSIEAPVITEPSVVKNVGESVTTTITCATDGASIYYTTDGSDPKTSTTRQAYSSALTFEETTTLRAIAYKEIEGTGYYSAEAEARTYTFVNNNGVVYDLVTDNRQLNETNVYIVVNKANHTAMSVTQNTNNRGATGVKFVNEAAQTQVYGNSEVAVFTLKKVGNNWYLQDVNSGGYLCVGNGNTLLTETSADGNAEATINIDGTSEAHISFMYNYETVRYLRYWLTGRAFSTYTSENSNLPVSLYYTASTPLAVIEKSGVKDQSYTVADDLQVVYVTTAGGKEVAWARDLVDNIDAVEIPTGPDKVDYLRHAGQQTGEWQQNNWVMLDLSENNKYYNNFSQVIGTNPVHLIIKGGSLSGQYVDDVNYTIKVSADANLVFETPEQNYTPNVYCAANYGADQNGLQQGVYWFMTPKVMEVCEHTWAVWNGDGFYVPEKELVNGQWHNEAGLVGAFAANWTYNSSSQFQPTVGEVYRFLSVVTRKSSTQGAGAPRRVGVQPSDINGEYEVAPLNLEGGEQVITAVSQLQAGREVVCVTYCDVAGRMSQKPFEGLNIIVTRYSDGTAKTTKAIY